MIKELIASGEIPPHTPLHERDVADRVGVSRTPVREALRLLAQEGWLCLSGRTYHVKPLTRKDVREIFELRLSNELLALELGFNRLVSGGVAEIHSLWEEMKQYFDDGDCVSFLKADRDFHTALARASGNGRLLAIITGLTENFVVYGVQSFQADSERRQAILSEIKDILDAISQYDLSTARATLTYHILSGRRVLMEHTTEDEDGE